jgi:RNA polymerase sigma factor (sigma-70 family)
MNPSAATHQADDAALVAASRRGEIEAFGRLVERYQNLVCAIAFGHTGDRRLSEDVGQETFLTAWRKLDTIREPEKLRSWLCGIARHLAGKAARRARREQVADADSIAARAGADPGPLEAALSRETEETVWRALADLPPTYREPLVLFYREDQSVKEVAAGLGLSEAVARQRLSRGRKALKEGVSDLVERTLASSRPRRAFTAAVLAALASVAGSASAAGAASAAGGTGAAPAAAASRGFAGGSKVLAIGLGAAVTVAILAAVLLIRASGSGGSGAAGPAAPAPAGADDAQIDRGLSSLVERRQARSWPGPWTVRVASRRRSPPVA